MRRSRSLYRRAVPAAAAGVIALVLASAGCGGEQPTEPRAPLSIEAALRLAGEGPLSVSGFLLAPQGGETRLCSALLESYPPQCGGPSLVVKGLDLATVEGLTGTSPDEPDLAQVQWTDAQVTLGGEVDGTVLTVSPALP